MKPSDKIRVAHRLPETIIRLIGIDMISSSVNPRIAGALLICSTFCVMFLNGCYQNLDDPYKFLHAAAPSTIILVILTRIFNLFYRNWRQFDPTMFKQTIEFYEKYERDPRYSNNMSKRASEIGFLIKLQTYCSFFCFLMPAATSIVPYLLTGQKMLFINDYLPWTDPNETFDYILNLVLLTALVLFAFAALSFSDIMLGLYGYQIVAFCDMLCCHVTELGEDLEKLWNEGIQYDLIQEENTSIKAIASKIMARKSYEKKLKELEKRFVDIVKEHHDYDNFIQTMIYYVEIPCFFQMGCNALSIGICIVWFFKVSMPLGTAGALLFGSQVVLPCLIGTMITAQNNRFADHILDFPWFYMSRGKQKVFLQFIHAVGNTTEFIMPIFGTEINLEAFTEVCNVSYSYFTFFWNFVNR